MIRRSAAFIGVLCCFLFMHGCNDPGDEIEDAIVAAAEHESVQDTVRAKNRPLRIGIIPLPLCNSVSRSGTRTQLGNWLTNRVESSISGQSSAFSISLKGNAITEILDNNNLETIDLYDNTTVQSLGHFVGTDILFLGYYQTLRTSAGERQVEINAKIVDVKTATIMGRTMILEVPVDNLPIFTHLMYVHSDYANIRSRANRRSDQVGTLAHDEEVEVFEITNGWARIALDTGQTGYIKASLLRPKPRIDSLLRPIYSNWEWVGLGFGLSLFAATVVFCRRKREFQTRTGSRVPVKLWHCAGLALLAPLLGGFIVIMVPVLIRIIALHVPPIIWVGTMLAVTYLIAAGIAFVAMSSGKWSQKLNRMFDTVQARLPRFLTWR